MLQKQKDNGESEADMKRKKGFGSGLIGKKISTQIVV